MVQEVQSLKRGRSGVPSGTRAEYLKGWLREASREIDLVTYQWRLLVRLIHKIFKDGLVPEEVAWDTMVFLLKWREGYRVIGLVGVV